MNTKDKKTYPVWLEIKGKPQEHTLLRLSQANCTMLGKGLPQDVDGTKTSKNTVIEAHYEIRPNLDHKKGDSKTKPFRFVDGCKIMFAEIFGEVCETYNRRQKRKDRKQTVETYYDKCHERWQKSYDKWSAQPKGPAKDKAYKKIFNYAKTLEIRIGENAECCPSKQEMDEFARDYVKWFKERFPQMVIFMACVTYDEMESVSVNGKKEWRGKAPCLHIGFIPIAISENYGMDKRVGWNTCLKQSTGQDTYAFQLFRQSCLRACAKYAKANDFLLTYVSSKYGEEDEDE